MKKNEIYNLDIIDCGSNFEGISKYEGIVTFIPGAIIGENVNAKVIKVTSSYAILKLEKILKESKYRVKTFCDVGNVCGGCQATNIEYDFQLIQKKNMVKVSLDKQKVEYEKINNTFGMGMPYYYRNKVQYPVREINGKNIIGFYKKNSHDIVENKCCYIQNRVIDILAKNIFDELIKLKFNGYNEKNGSGDIRHIVIRRGYHTEEIMIIVVVNNKKLLDDLRFNQFVINIVKNNTNISSIFLNLNDMNTNVILGDKLKKIYGRDYISDFIGDYEFYISPKSFFQVNTIQAEVLYNVLKTELCLDKTDILFDLYSGVGTIGIFLSQYVNKVYGIEIEQSAVEMANLNIKKNNVKNAEYIAGSVEDKIEEFKKRNINPDVIVVDPPRKGLDDKSIKYIIDFAPKKIGYVSCNYSTMSRDLKKISDIYSVKSITPVDMFPHTSHVECVAVMTLKNNI